MYINRNITITPDMHIKIIEWMSEGLTPVQVASKLGLSKQRLDRLVARPEMEDLRETMELGFTHYEAYMESVGQKLIGSKIGKESVWKSFMMKYFDWNDKKDINVSDKDWIATASIDELEALEITTRKAVEQGYNKPK
jgi:hypothetical protein